MTTQTTTIKNGTIVLPRELWSEWRGNEILIKPQQNNKLLIEKIVSRKQNVVLTWKRHSEKPENSKPYRLAKQN